MLGLSDRMRRYGTSLDMPGDHGVTATIGGFADEIAVLEAEAKELLEVLLLAESMTYPCDECDWMACEPHQKINAVRGRFQNAPNP